MPNKGNLMKYLDDVIVELYVDFDIPADRLVSDPMKLQRFADLYHEKTDQDVKLADFAHHILNLRRRGEAKGGLPRLRRSYQGRGPSRN